MDRTKEPELKLVRALQSVEQFLDTPAADFQDDAGIEHHVRDPADHRADFGDRVQVDDRAPRDSAEKRRVEPRFEVIQGWVEDELAFPGIEPGEPAFRREVHDVSLRDNAQAIAAASELPGAMPVHGSGNLRSIVRSSNGNRMTGVRGR